MKFDQHESTTDSIPVSQTSDAFSQQQSTSNDFTTTERSQTTSTEPISFDEALNNVEQWSDVIADYDTTTTSSSSSSHRASHISHLLPSVNEYEDEQHIGHTADQRLAIGSAGVSGRAATVTQTQIGPDVPVLDESSVALGQLRRSQIPQPFEYKASSAIKEESGAMLRTTASAMSGYDEPAQETPTVAGHLSRPESGGSKRQVISISQPSISADFSTLEESAVNLDQVHRPDTPQSVQYKAPAGMLPSSSSILTTTSALGEDVPAQETPVNINQLRQPTAKDLPTSQTTGQQASSVTQLSASTDSAMLDESAVHLGQVHRPDAPQTVQYKSPAGIQPSSGSILTTASARGGDVPEQETPVNITQLRQPTAKDLPTSRTTGQQATSVTQPSATIDLPILDESAVHLDQVHRPEAPQTVQYKSPAGIQPSIGSILTTASALGGDVPEQETPVNITQLRQPTAKDLPTSQTTGQQASSVTQLSASTDSAILDESAVHLDQVHRPDTPQTVQYKSPAGIQPSTGSILTTASALGGDVPEQETPVNITQLRQPTAKDLPTSQTTGQQASSVTQLSASTDSVILDESAVHLDQVHRPDTPQTVQYKSPAGIQPSTGSILTTASALGGDVPEQETPVNITQLRQPTAKDLPTSDSLKQHASPVTQLSATTDLPMLDETAVHLDQVHRPEASETVHYKAPADIQPSFGSILTTASALGGDVPAQETPVNINQLRQPTAKDLPTSQTTGQQASSVTQLSASTDSTMLDESAVHLDQVHRPEAPQTVQYKAPTGLQTSSGSILTTASALGGEEPAQETPVNITQLRQPIAKDLPTSQTTGQQASSVTQLSASTDSGMLDESAVHLDQVHRPEASQTVQYKAPADIQPSSGSILTTASALGGEEPAQETSINVTQLRQATAQASPDGIKQHASSISQPSIATDLPLFEETAVHIDQGQLAHKPQPFEYKAPTNIKEVTANLHSTPSALASEAEDDNTILSSVGSFQQPHGHKTQRTSVISDLSYASAEDEFAELPYELQVQQQRLLKMPPKIRDQPKLIQSRASLVETDDQTQSTPVNQRRQMVAALQKQEGKKDEEDDKKEKENSISPEPSMDVDEVIETIRLEDELLETNKPFIPDIPAPTEGDISPSTLTTVDVLPPIEELPQTTSEEISEQLHQLENVSSDQRVEVDILPPINAEIQGLLSQLEQVSSKQPAPLDLSTIEEILSSATIEKEPQTPMAEKTEEPFEIITSEIIDYIEIPPAKTVSDEHKPEAIVVTAERESNEDMSRVEGEFNCS
jgi:hypothetical protein